MFHHQKFVKNAVCKNALLNSTSFSPLNYWQKLLNVAELLSASKQSKSRPRKYNLKAEVSITPLLAALLAACSDTNNVPVGGTSDGTNVTTPTDDTPAQSFYLYVLDGAIEGARVYVDENNTGEIADNQIPIGTTDGNGRVFIDAEYVGETFLIDASGAFDLFTGESLPSGILYRASSDASGGSDVVASPISTIVQALRENDPALTDTDILELIFGAGTQIEIDDLSNPDNFILPTDTDPKPIGSPEAIAEQIASTSIRLQVLIEQENGNLALVLPAVTDGFVAATDLDINSQGIADDRIMEARQRANGEPVANPVAGIEVNEDEDLPLAMDVWGFRDPVGNRNVNNTTPSSFARLDIVSITNGVLVASDGTEYGAGGQIPSAQLGNLVFRPATDYFGDVQITYTVFDGEDDSDEATLAITVNGINDAPVIDRTDVETEFSIAGGSTDNVIDITATDVEGDTLSYSLVDGDDAALFQISDTGVVRWATPPVFDASSDNLYSVTVVVSDGDATDTITLTITVTDIDPNAPVFSSDGSPPNQDENIAANNSEDTQASAVAIYEARAESASGDVTYSLAGTDAALFGIDAEGDIWFRSPPDHESGKTSYSFTVVASVTVNDVELITEQAVTLNINDLNDSPPTFAILSDAVSVSVDENVLGNFSDNTQDDAMTIYDAGVTPDVEGANVSYSLGGADSSFFGMNDGKVWFKASPNFESSRTAYSFTVTATVGAQTATQTVMVTVRDVNEAPVISTTSDDDIVVAGGSTANVIMIAATDVDDGDTLSYSLVDGDDAALFQISDTGVVRWNAPPVFDASSPANNVYDVTVRVRDAGGLEDTITLTITIVDVDPNAPVFLSDGSPPNQDENIAANNSEDTQASAVAIYEARAESAGGDVTYSLAGTDAALFGIDAEGDIWFRSPPDHESGKTSYSFTVVASVTVNDVELITEQAVTLNINDLNDSPPIFADTSDAVSVNVDENVLANDSDNTQDDAMTIYDAGVTPDVEGATVSYSLGGADSSFFGMNDGKVWFKASPDFETKSGYSFTVTATVGAQTATQTVMVTIDNVNEAPVISTTSDDDIVVAGGSTANVIMIAATDVDDGDTLSYSLVDGDDAALFQISDTGVVTWETAAPVFDASSPANNVYDVTVRVRDAGGLEDTITLTITIVDVDPNAPVFLSDGSPPNQDENIAANNSEDTQASAVAIYEARAESAGGDVTYSLAGTDAALFGIDAEGDIWFRSPPDHESGKTSYSFTVVASVTVNDVELITEQAVTLNINDLNDSPPIFADTSDAVSVNVDENVLANDSDNTQDDAMTIYDAGVTPDVEGATVSYSLGGADSSFFGMNDGKVWFKASPDFETKSGYSFTVTATVGAQTATQTVMVTIDNVNEAPVISTTSDDDIVVAGGSTANVIMIAATDVDDGDTLSYSLVDGDDAALFQISDTGVVTWETAAPVFDASTPANNVYDVTVRVRDAGGLEDTITLTITIVAVDPNAPVFLSDGSPPNQDENIAANNSEDTQASAVAIYEARAESAGGDVTYSLAGTDAALFGIDAEGDIWFRSPPDHESGKTSYSFTVVASVTVAGVVLTTEQAVTLNINDLNDSPPVFASGDTASVSVDENVLANDSDNTQDDAMTIYDAGVTPDVEGANVSYSLGGADSSFFGMNDGKVWFKASPDFETKSGYSFTVTATVGAQTATQTVTVTVRDVNEAPVISTTSDDAIVVAEGSTDDVIDIDASDEDTSDTLSYSIRDTDADADAEDVDAAAFDINETTGVVTWKVAPDHESPADRGRDNTYNVTVVVTDDDGNAPATDSIDLTIRVTDLNDSPPEFASGNTASANANIAVNNSDDNSDGSGAVIYIASARPDVEGDDVVIVYSLASADTTMFGIDSSDGDVWVKVRPVYTDTNPTGSFTVTATVTVANGVPQTASQVVTVSANIAPVLTPVGTPVSIAENTRDQTDTEVTFTVSDAENATFTFEDFTVYEGAIGTADTDISTRFDVLFDRTDDDGNNIYKLVLLENEVLNNALNYEAEPTVTLRVVVSDGTANSNEVRVEVTVMDVNEAPVIGNSADIEVAENITLVDEDGERVVDEAGLTVFSLSAVTIVATDVDEGDTLKYSLSGTDANQFNIDEDTGVVEFMVAPNYEIPTDSDGDNEYSVTVTVTDDDGDAPATDSIDLTITVTDVNDPGQINRTSGLPAIMGINTGTLPETASDQTDTNIFLAFYDEDGDELEVPRISDSIGMSDEVNFNMPSKYFELDFVGTDFVNYGGTATNPHYLYKLVILPGAVFDFETMPLHRVWVMVSDVNRLGEFTYFNINITDEAQPLVFTSSETASVEENIAANDHASDQGGAEEVYQAVAVPDDITDAVVYSLLDTDDSDSFGINATTGVVWFKESPDYEDGNEREYIFTVRASVTVDGVTETADHEVKLDVRNANDSFTWRIRVEGADSPDHIAEDINVETDTGHLFYLSHFQDVAQANVFKVYEGTSEIESTRFDVLFDRPDDDSTTTTIYKLVFLGNNSLDFETEPVIEIRLSVLVFGRPYLTEYFNINITDVFESPLVFTSSATVSVDENVAANDDGDTQGSAATIYTAVAKPDDITDPVIYSLLDTDDGDSFGINASTGDVWFLRSPDYEDEDEREYTFTVVASVTADGVVTQTASQIITLSVDNINDNNAGFQWPRVTNNIVEDLGVGTGTDADTGLRAAAFDADGNNVFSGVVLEPTATDVFGIPSTRFALVFDSISDGSGRFTAGYSIFKLVLLAGNELDYETEPTIELRLRIHENTGSTSVGLVFNVRDVHATLTVNATGSGSIVENTADLTTNTDTGITLTTSGADANTTFTAASFTIYEADDGASDRFDVVGNSTDGFKLVLRAGQSADYETENPITLRVRVTDGVANSAVLAIMVTVTDANDAPTTDTENTANVITGTVTEDTPGDNTTSGEFIATDVDANDTLSYSLPAGGEGIYGTLTLDTAGGTNGGWTYVLDNTRTAVNDLNGGETLEDKITLRATDRDGAYVDQVITITINGRTDVIGTDAGDSLGDVTATLSQTIQGGNLDDTLVAGSGGDVLIGGAGDDTITLGIGKDTIGYRIASTDGGLVGSDGNDTINGFVVDVENALSEDKFVFVDTDATPLGNFADLIALAKGDTAQLIVRLLKTGADYSGFEFTFTGGDDNDANDVSLTINLDTILGGSSVVQGNKYFGNGGIDTANDQLTDTGLDNFVTNFGDNFEVLSADELGIEIL